MTAKRRKKPKVYHSKVKARPPRKVIILRRLLVVCLLAAVVAGLVFGLVSGVKCVGAFFMSRNPSFTLKTIEVTSDGRLQPDQLREFCGVQAGTNLFAVDTKLLRRKLEELALVESVTISRILPDKMEINVTERVAIAQLRWSTRGLPFLLDPNGVVLPMSDSGSALPLIDGYKPERLQQGDRVADPGISQCLKILVAVDELGLGADVSFSSFDIRYADFVRAVVNRDVTVQFPLHSTHEKLALLAGTLRKARELGHPVKTIDLTPNGRNVFVTPPFK